MVSETIIITAIISAIGFLLNMGLFVLVIRKRKKTHHYLFAVILFICAIWDLGILFSMLRNTHENELVIYGYVVFLPCLFLAPLIYQITTSYLGKKQKVLTIIFWGQVSCRTGSGEQF